MSLRIKEVPFRFRRHTKTFNVEMKATQDSEWQESNRLDTDELRGKPHNFKFIEHESSFNWEVFGKL